MEDIRITLADNLTKLRKKHKLTQVELAHQLGFSDKAISKWEQGDTIPDIETIKKIADLYGVTIDSLLEEVPIETESETKERKRIMTNKIIITLLAVTVVWTSSIVWFTIIKILNNYYFWQAFIWALPFSSIIILIFNSVWGNKRFTYMSVMCRAFRQMKPEEQEKYLAVGKALFASAFAPAAPAQNDDAAE